MGRAHGLGTIASAADEAAEAAEAAAAASFTRAYPPDPAWKTLFAGPAAGAAAVTGLGAGVAHGFRKIYEALDEAGPNIQDKPRRK